MNNDGMIKLALIALVGVFFAGSAAAISADATAASAAAAASGAGESAYESRDDYQSVYARAEKAAAQAEATHSAWTVTEAALKESKKAAADKQFDKASGLARHAQALAEASIRQAEQQRTAWHREVVR